MIWFVKWFGKELLRKCKQNSEQGLDKAAAFLVNEVVQSFGSPPPLPVEARTARGKRITARKWRRAHHAPPGQPPFVQTGTLRRSITFATPRPLSRHVGSTLKPQGGSPSYAMCLERGTSKMAARPYLRPALEKNRKEIMRLIAHG